MGSIWKFTLSTEVELLKEHHKWSQWIFDQVRISLMMHGHMQSQLRRGGILLVLLLNSVAVYYFAWPFLLEMDICFELVYWTVCVMKLKLLQVPFRRVKFKNAQKPHLYFAKFPPNAFPVLLFISYIYNVHYHYYQLIYFKIFGLERSLMFSMHGVLLFMAGFWVFSQCLNRVSSSDPLFVQGFKKICGWLPFECTADLSIAWCEWKMKLHWKSA